ncbi:HAMP domain-containing sensor histidine kinase [Spirulina sp. CS-785/01]|nr:HAMP domain-containing sensor histidine kinase [Spirulina sp. CS-785/01]MDB9314881.1 HAMP domain-containing sensor histidine kinase [Spirulina sp. CS-785/01]
MLMNILSNAIDAVEEKQNKIQSGVLQEECFVPTIEIQTTCLEKERVQIKISDNGIGMPQDVIEKIYDPFYTTKPIGKGTGLGLAIAYQIMHDCHEGILQCSSGVGKGTTFILEIPCHPQTAPLLQNV